MDLTLKRQEKTGQEYTEAYCAILNHNMALLPGVLLDQIKACTNWPVIRDTSNIVKLQAAATAAVSNANKRHYTPV